MAKKDLQDSVKDKVYGLAHSLKVVRADIRKISNYERSLTTKIIDFCELYGITNEVEDVFSIVEEPQNNQVSLKKLLELFPETDTKSIVDNIVAKIDFEKTEENLRFSAEFQEPIVKNIVKQIKKAAITNKKEVKLK